MSQSVQIAQALDIAIEMVPRDARPEQVLEDLAAHAQGPGAQHLDAIVLDADERGLEDAVEWVSAFHDEYRRQAATFPDAWENALRQWPDQDTRPIPPVLIVLASEDRLNETLGNVEARLAGAGAVVYGKPHDLAETPSNLAHWLRDELTEAYSRFWSEEQSTGEPEASQAAEGTPNLGAYLAPVYQLSEDDFEALLQRGRSADPLATGE